MEIFKLFGRILIDNEDANRKIDETDAKAEKTGRTFGSMLRTVGMWGAGIAAAAGSAAAGLAGLVFRATQAATEVVKLSQTTGFSTRGFQEWDHVMRQFGWSMGQASNNLANFQERIMQASQGSGEAAAAFQELGVQVVDSSGRLRSSEAVFEDTIRALQQMEDVTRRNALASQLLGNTAEEIAPVLNMTAEELASLRASAHVISDEDLRRADQFATVWGTVKTALSTLVIDLGLKFLPTVERAVSYAAEHVPKIGPVFEFVAEVVSIVLKYLRLMVSDAFTWMRNNVIDPFTEWMITVWQERGPPIVEAVQALWDGVKAVFGAVFDVLRGLWDAFILAFQGDWQGAWERVKETATNLWNALPELFTGIINPLIDIADNIMTAVIDVIRAVFGDDVADLFQQAWDAVVVVFEAARDILLGIWTALTAAFRGDWQGAWEAILDVVDTAWSAIETVVETALNIIRTIIDGALNGIVALIRWAFGDEAAAVVESAFNVIRDIVDGLTDVILGIVRTFAALFRGDWEAAWNEARNVVSRAWDVIETTVQGALDLITSILDGAMDGIVALIRWAFGDETADVVDGLFDALRLIVDTGSEAIMGVIRAFAALFRGDWEAAWQEIRDVAIGIWNALPEIFEQSLDGIVGIADSIMQAVMGVIRQLFGDEIADSMSGIWDTILDVLDVFRDTFLGVWRALTAAFSGDWSAAWDEVVGVVTRVWTAIPGVVEGALNNVFGIVDTILTSIIGLIERLFGERVASVFQRAWDAVTIVFETARDTLLGILDVLSSLFAGDWEEAWEGVLDILTRIWDGVLGIIAGPLDGVVDWVASWVLTIHGLFTAMRDAVVAAVRNTAEGISEWFSETKLGRTFNWLGEQVRNVTGWFYDMYDRVVGHSYIPDMVEEIGEAIERLRERLANPVVRYTAEALASFEGLSEGAVEAAYSIAEAFDQALESMSKRLGEVMTEITAQFFHGTATWGSILDQFAGFIGSSFRTLFNSLATELARNLIAQNTWLTQTLANVATAVTAYLSQAFAALTAFFWWAGPAAPVLAGGVIAAAIAAIAALGGQIVRAIFPSVGGSTTPPQTDTGDGDRSRSPGRQVMEITGPTRDLLTTLLSPLARLDEQTGILVRIHDLLDARLPMMRDLALAGPGGITVNVYAGLGADGRQIGEDVLDVLEEALADRLTYDRRGESR